MSTNFFSASYAEARSRFLSATSQVGGSVTSLFLDPKGPGGEDLAIDIAWFGTKMPRRVFLHSSGLHGVEGFAGSAIQLQMLSQRKQSLEADSAIGIIHILNPYGMAWFRRTNEHNVDLNRNFADPTKYSGAPPGYAEVREFLNPSKPPSVGLAYYLRVLGLIAKHGFATLKGVIATGQYEYPNGLFFGGKELERGPALLRDYLHERLANAVKIVAIDVHTGLGSHAADTLLVESLRYNEMVAALGARVRPLDVGRSPAYRVEGAFYNIYTWASSRAGPSNIYFAFQEFGTYPPLAVLAALREENYWHNTGVHDVTHPAKLRLRETFAPERDGWRRAILKRGSDVIECARKLAFS